MYDPANGMYDLSDSDFSPPSLDEAHRKAESPQTPVLSSNPYWTYRPVPTCLRDPLSENHNLCESIVHFHDYFVTVSSTQGDISIRLRYLSMTSLPSHLALLSTSLPTVFLPLAAPC
ncbi:hypothetical protein KCU61_g642, partial [Aureobasidium melanogenum]